MGFVFLRSAALGVAFFTLTLSPSFADGCNDYQAPTVVVNSPSQPTVIDRQKGVADLTTLMGQHASLEHAGFVTLGVTSVDYKTTLSASIKIEKSRFGNWCAYPMNVVVNHGFSKPVMVHIAKELPNGSCKYRTTLEHEMRHVKYHEEGVWRASLEINKAINSSSASSFPVNGNSKEEVSNAVNRRISEIVEGAVKRVASSVRAKNDAMDTPEAYRAFSALCN